MGPMGGAVDADQQKNLINRGVKAFLQLDGGCVVQRGLWRGYSVRIEGSLRPKGFRWGHGEEPMGGRDDKA